MMTVIKPKNFDTHKFIQIESTAIDLTCPGVSRIEEEKKDTSVSKMEGEKEEEEEGNEGEDGLFPPVRTWKKLKKHGMERMLLPDGWSLRQWSNGHNREGDDHMKVFIMRNFKKDNPGKLVRIPEGYDLRLVKSRQPTCSRCNNHPEHPSVDGKKMKLKGINPLFSFSLFPSLLLHFFFFSLLFLPSLFFFFTLFSRSQKKLSVERLYL